MYVLCRYLPTYKTACTVNNVPFPFPCHSFCFFNIQWALLLAHQYHWKWKFVLRFWRQILSFCSKYASELLKWSDFRVLKVEIIQKFGKPFGFFARNKKTCFLSGHFKEPTEWFVCTRRNCLAYIIDCPLGCK